MIYESSYWKDDLLKLADKLERRIAQRRWGEKNFYSLEKDIFLGFYSVRKLIESYKISDSLKNKSYKIREFPYSGQPESISTNVEAGSYDLSKGREVSITIAQLCNQFIHSHHFHPFFIPGGKYLVGFFFCSDHKRTTCIYLITIFDVVEIYWTVRSSR